MPITFIPNVPTLVGPGTSLFVQTDLIGPIPLDWQYVALVYGPASTEQETCSWSQNAAGLNSAILENFNALFSAFEGFNIQDGQPCELRVVLRTADGLTDEDDSGRIPITWDGNGQLARWLQNQAIGGGGFTEADRTVITDTQTTVDETNQLALAINDATQIVTQFGAIPVTLTIGQALATHTLDFLADRDLSGGVTCDPVRYDASLNALYGVVVAIDVIPPETVFRTPDGQYSFPDLAVLKFVRGGNVIQRHGIHTLSHTVYPLPGLPFPWLVEVAAPLQPPDYHIEVDWATGVCGHLIGLSLP